MKSTNQLCDSIIESFNEISKKDKESAGIALISIIAQRAGFHPLQADCILSQAKELLDTEYLDSPQSIAKLITAKELIN